MHRLRLVLTIVLLGFTFRAGAGETLRLPAVFSDHMVLQRAIAAPVWGWAAPGTVVTVEFAGQKATATADAEGAWRVTLNAMPANKAGQALTVTAGDACKAVADVLVGDVWVSCGQSNMMFKLASSAPGDGIGLGGILRARADRYDWNSDLLAPGRFRPGTIVGYRVDAAAAGGAISCWFNLACSENAAGSDYWGGIPKVDFAPGDFRAVEIAMRMKPSKKLSGKSAGVGFRAYTGGTEGSAVYLDNFFPITLIRPQLGLSSAAPLELPAAAPGETTRSVPRRIYNAQVKTLPHKPEADGEAKPVPTILYGIANVEVALHWSIPHTLGATDDVGAVILGEDAERFAFVSDHRGDTPRALRLIGPDGKSGLLGGPEPEAEALQIEFAGANEQGTYAATVRIVTQAGNRGALSTGGPGEPLEHLFYVDIPVTCRVEKR